MHFSIKTAFSVKSWESDKSEHLDKHTDISRFPLAFDISLGSHVLKKKQYGGVEEPDETND